MATFTVGRRVCFWEEETLTLGNRYSWGWERQISGLSRTESSAFQELVLWYLVSDHIRLDGRSAMG